MISRNGHYLLSGLDLSSAHWRKSTYSNGANTCVEVAGVWRKSTYSSSNSNCVEVAVSPAPAAVAVRDTKDRSGPVLVISPGEWRAFTGRIRAGDVPAG